MQKLISQLSSDVMECLWEGALDRLSELAEAPPPEHPNLRAVKETRYPGRWVVNPVRRVLQHPKIAEFSADKNRKMTNVVFTELYATQLVSKQEVVRELGVAQFIRCPDIPPILVARVDGLNYIYNGNHRAVAALLATRKIKAKVFTL